MMKQLGEPISRKVESGAGYMVFMNGLNKSNHSNIDRCFTKIMKEDPRIDPTIPLAWTVRAQNRFSMYRGYLSYQLVFGKNPTLPNMMKYKLLALNGVTISESVADHINAI